MTTRTLYLCYFGLREPLVQTQVLPYLRQLASAGVEVSLLTFEPSLKQKWTTEQLTLDRASLKNEGIRWSQLPYHKRPSAPATFFDVMAGARFAARYARRNRIHVLHARAHVPMAMALLARLFGARCRTVFDIRGLMADEYTDAGIWQENSLPYRMVKKVERAGVARADQIVVLTRRLRDWLIEKRLTSGEKIEVIPCCVDFSRYDRASGAQQGAQASERFEVVYAGAVTGLYLLEEMGRFFLEIRARRADAFFRVMTLAAPDEVTVKLKRVGLDPSDFHVGAVSSSEVPAYLRQARVGVSFRKPTFSQIAASPTKIPEYLAAGLPVVSNAGIGDVDELLEKEGVGTVVQSFDASQYAEVAERILALAEDTATRARCLHAARTYFDLVGIGGVGYRNVYRRIAEGLTEVETKLEAAG